MKTLEFRLLNIALLILLLCVVYLNLTAKPAVYESEKQIKEQANTHTLALDN